MRTINESGSGGLLQEDQVSPQTVLTHLANVVRKQREALEISIEDMALRTSISVSDLNAFELGEWDIDLVSLDSIASCLNMKLKLVFISTEALVAKARRKRD